MIAKFTVTHDIERIPVTKGACALCGRWKFVLINNYCSLWSEGGKVLLENGYHCS